MKGLAQALPLWTSPTSKHREAAVQLMRRRLVCCPGGSAPAPGTHSTAMIRPSAMLRKTEVYGTSCRIRPTGCHNLGARVEPDTVRAVHMRVAEE